jgi:hypothetical protein
MALAPSARGLWLGVNPNGTEARAKVVAACVQLHIRPADSLRRLTLTEGVVIWRPPPGIQLRASFCRGLLLLPPPLRLHRLTGPTTSSAIKSAASLFWTETARCDLSYLCAGV